MNENEMKGFLALDQDLGNEYALFTYVIETPLNPLEAAAHLCMEQSTAQWSRVGVKEDFRTKHGAKVVKYTHIKTSPQPQVLRMVEGKEFHLAQITIAHPIINFGMKIPNLITAAAGEGAFHCPGINSIKLMDIDLPQKYLREFVGPRFGIKGLRKMLGIKERPLFTGVVKPNIGLKPEYFAELAFQAWKGGFDICKDDEMLADVPYSPLKQRLELVLQKMFKAEDATGEKKMFIANITDEVDRLGELHDLVVGLGGNAVMLNTMPVGLSAVRALAKKTKVPIFSHFDFIAPFTRVPYFGVHSPLVTKLQRLSGCDGIIMPGLGKRMLVPEAEVKENVRVCSKELGAIAASLPVPGGSDWAGSLAPMIEAFGMTDFSMVPGRAVFGHPNGPEGGARSFREAWEAYQKGVSIQEYARTHEDLRKAIEMFGGGKS